MFNDLDLVIGKIVAILFKIFGKLVLVLIKNLAVEGFTVDDLVGVFVLTAAGVSAWVLFVTVAVYDKLKEEILNQENPITYMAPKMDAELENAFGNKDMIVLV